MKKKISIFVINAVFVGLITVLWTSLVLTYILPKTNATHDTVISQPDTTVISQPDTLSFDEEMAIVDSMIRIQNGISYEDDKMIPNQEITTVHNQIQQTIIRYPNGMPKIAVVWEGDGGKPVRYIIDKRALAFYSDNGNRIAFGWLYEHHSNYRWWCDMPTKTVNSFEFSNPNVCRNIKRY